MSNVVEGPRTVVKVLRSLVDAFKAEGLTYVSIEELEAAISKVEG